MKKWSLPIGAALTCAGILIGFDLPVLVGHWGAPVEIGQEQLTQMRVIIVSVLVLLGAVLQIYGSWPDQRE